MGRRPVGTGSVFRRKADKRWIAQVSTGGRSHRSVTRRVRRTKADALEALEELRAEAGLTSPTMTTGEWLRSWLVTAGRSVRPSTLETYEIAVRLQLVPHLGAIRLSRLGPEHVEAMVRTLDLTMSPKGIANVLGVLGRALSVAELRGLVRRNVARLVEPPRRERADPAAITVEDAKRILCAVKGDRLEALYVLALATGMRQAELLGLVWADWDRAAGTIRVAYALDRVGGRYVRVEPKTRRSRRTVTLPAFATRALVRHRRAQLAERLAAGVKTEDGHIFVTAPGHPSKQDPDGLGGRPINGGWLSHHWTEVVAKAAGVSITMHGLRHAQADLLIAAGVSPKTAADRLGHSTTAMTMDVYAGRAADADREAARLLQEAVG